jgi:hypothetical protein
VVRCTDHAHWIYRVGRKLPMITTTTAPPWLRRSDQAVTWARSMLSPHRAVVIDCETTDLPGALTGRKCYQNLRNWPPTRPVLWRQTGDSDRSRR